MGLQSLEIGIKITTMRFDLGEMQTEAARGEILPNAGSPAGWET